MSNRRFKVGKKVKMIVEIDIEIQEVSSYNGAVGDLNEKQIQKEINEEINMFKDNFFDDFSVKAEGIVNGCSFDEIKYEVTSLEMLRKHEIL